MTDAGETEGMRGVRMVVGNDGSAMSVGEDTLVMHQVDEVVGFAAGPAGWVGDSGIEFSVSLQLMVMDAGAVPAWLADGARGDDPGLRALGLLKLSMPVARKLASELNAVRTPLHLPPPKATRRSRRAH